MIQRRDKTAGGNPNMIFIVLGIMVVFGGIGGVIFSKWKKENPIIDPALHNLTIDKYLVAKTDPTLNPEISMRLNSNDPLFNIYQDWQMAKRVARRDLPSAIATVEKTVKVAPEYSGDAYFTIAQCIEFSMEIPLYENKDNPLLSRDEIAARYNREFKFYDMAIEAYSRPNAQTLLGITRDPEEQIRKIRDTIIEDKKVIKEWWMAKVQ